MNDLFFVVFSFLANCLFFWFFGSGMKKWVKNN